MKIKDTKSIVIIKDAPLYVMETTQKLPLKLFWWEGKLTNGILKTSFMPKGAEHLEKPISLDEFFNMEEVEKDDDVLITFDLYFYKVKE